jgi:hypothetical protein
VQNSAGTTSLQITDNNLLCLGGTTSSFPAIKRNGTAIDFRLADDSNFASLNTNSQTITSTIALSAGATNPRIENIAYTINNTGAQTGTATGIFLNATETNLNGQNHNLMDLQRDGVSRFNVNSFGSATFAGSLGVGTTLQIGLGSILSSISSGVIRLTNPLLTDFNRLQFGGTTSSFPAIKRNGATIDFRLADDSGYCDISAKNINAADINNTFVTIDLKSDLNPRVGSTFSVGQLVAGNTTQLYSGSYLDLKIATAANTYTTILRAISGSIVIGVTAVNASAILQADSTTKGFLMPRQTQAQILAIAAPANGLMVYNTDINIPCFYDGTAWRRVSHSLM